MSGNDERILTPKQEEWVECDFCHIRTMRRRFAARSPDETYYTVFYRCIECGHVRSIKVYDYVRK
jgi:DNA-directed RNA polymerase subunit M/transcription elongation factor TFIIS